MGKFSSLKGKPSIALSAIKALKISDEEIKTVLTRTVGLGIELRQGMALALKGEPVLCNVDGKAPVNEIGDLRKGAYWSLSCDILSEDGDVLAKDYGVPCASFWRTGKRFPSLAPSIEEDGELKENTFGRRLFGAQIAAHPFSTVLYEKENEYSKVCSFWEQTGVGCKLLIAEEFAVWTLPIRSLDFKSRLGRTWGANKDDWQRQYVLFFDKKGTTDTKPASTRKTRTTKK